MLVINVDTLESCREYSTINLTRRVFLILNMSVKSVAEDECTYAALFLHTCYKYAVCKLCERT